MGLENIVQFPWPEQDGKYKVVQFMVDERPYLGFGQDSHRSIVKKFAEGIGAKTTIDFSKKDPPLLFADESRYKISGAGWCELMRNPKLEKRIAEFYGASSAYDIGIDKLYLDSIKETCPDIDIRYNPTRTK